jgi:hypothetical protein
VYFCSGNACDLDGFRTRLNPLLREERTKWKAEGETFEGAGCWSPLFPARFDDILLSATACVKAVEEHMKEESGITEVLVFEQIYEGTKFRGLRTVANPSESELSELDGGGIE